MEVPTSPENATTQPQPPLRPNQEIPEIPAIKQQIAKAEHVAYNPQMAVRSSRVKPDSVASPNQIFTYEPPNKKNINYNRRGSGCCFYYFDYL